MAQPVQANAEVEAEIRRQEEEDARAEAVFDAREAAKVTKCARRAAEPEADQKHHKRA